MPQLRIALAQVDLTVGDLAGNARLVLDWSARAGGAGAHLVAFPELTLTGYPPEDLVLRSAFVDASLATLHTLPDRLLAAHLGELAVVVGYLGRDDGGRAQNRVAFLHRGEIVATYAKHHLPNYGVFDERRYFTPGHELPVVALHGVDIALTICEDLWQDGGPIAACRAAGVGVVLCINGSPYEQEKDDKRGALVARRAVEAGAALAYVNAVGGQDELVFDGDSLVCGPDGQLLARAGQFAQELLVIDLDLPAGRSTWTGIASEMSVTRVVSAAEPVTAYQPRPPTIATRLAPEAETYAAIVTGTRDYVRKNGFASVVLGLSGGIDSALVATIAVDALGAAAVYTVAMPSVWSSPHSLEDAAELARRQRTNHSVVMIEPIVAAFQAAVPVHNLAAENLQARVRGTTLMALSNEHGHLVLTTGNKSELATGFSTLYGDSAGGFAPIKDLPKSWVWRLARWRNLSAAALGEVEPIPQNSIDKPPSAELAADQLDADRLPAYDLLDAILEGYVDGDLGRAELITAGHSADLVDRVMALVDTAEHKRRQYPPGPKLSGKAFGRDRRLPITHRWREPR